ncbi:MAG: hypothetical protein K0M60_13775 [Hydrogenophaga sp.]|nr:hypothetical protein [Hydrogenophaga sp.]
MLPPVNAVANSSIAFQDPRAAQDGATETHVRPQGALPQAANGLEQNAAIAGRLNLLLLTGQERMSDNLAILVNLLGSRLGMERADGESVSSYAARLVQALGDLTPQMRQSVQRQLAQMFGGLQLRTLMEAFRNPVGPEAATLSIYLELSRVKDKDLAARTVVTSYRQNGGETRANVLPASAPAVPGRTSAGAPAASTPATALPLRTEQGAQPLTETAVDPELIGGDTIDDPMAPVAKGRLFSMQDEQSRKMLKLAAARALQATMSYGAEPVSRNAGVEPLAAGAPLETSETIGIADDRQPHRDVDNASGPAAARALVARAGDAPASSARVMPEAVPNAGEDIPAEATHAETESRADKSDPATTQNPAMDGDGPRDAGDKTQTLFVLKGWQEDATRDAEPAVPAALPAPEDILPDPARLISLTAPGEDADADEATALPAETDARETLADETQSLADHDAEVVEQLEDAASDAATADPAAQELATAPHDLPDAELAQLRQQVAGRDGVPLPLVNYLFAADDMAEEKGLKHRFNQDHESEAGGQDADGSGGEDPGDSEGETPDETVEQRTSADDLEQDPAEAPVEGETPNDLYWRMAGWS